MPLTAETRCIEVTVFTGNDGGRNSTGVASLTDPEVAALIDAGDDSIRVTDTDGNPLAYQVLNYSENERALLLVNIPFADETNGNVVRIYTNADFGNADRVPLTSFGGNADANLPADRIVHDFTVFTHRARNEGVSEPPGDSADCANYMAHPCMREAEGWTAFVDDAAALAGNPTYTHLYTNSPIFAIKYENPCIYGAVLGETFTFETGGPFADLNPLQSWPNTGYRSDPSVAFDLVTNTLYVFDRRNDGTDTYLDRAKLTTDAGGSWEGVTVGAQEEIGETGTGELANVGKSASVVFDANGRLHMIAVGGGSVTGPINWLYSDSQGDAGTWEDVGTIEPGGGNPDTSAWHLQISNLSPDGYYYVTYSEGKSGTNLNGSSDIETGRVRTLRIREDDFKNLRVEGWEESRSITLRPAASASSWFGGGGYCPCLGFRSDGTADLFVSGRVGASHPDFGGAVLDLVTGRVPDIDLSDNTPSTAAFWTLGWRESLTYEPQLVFDFTGGSLEDRSGNGRDASLADDPKGGGTAGASWDEATGAWLFDDGTSVLDVGVDDWTRGSTEFVWHIEAAVETIGDLAGARAHVLGGMMYNSGATPYGLVIAVRQHTDTSTGVPMVFVINASGAAQAVTMTGAGRIDDGEFHIITMQRLTDPIVGTGFAEKIKLFVDGVYAGQVNVTGSGAIGGTGGSPVFGIGGSTQARPSTSGWQLIPLGSNGYDGRIRRFEVYDGGLFEFDASSPRSFGWDTAGRADVPNPLDAVALTPGDESLLVTWTLSGSGDAATQVDIEHADNRHFANSTTVQATASDGSALIESLTNNTTRYVRVRPTNAGGESLFSVPASAVIGATGGVGSVGSSRTIAGAVGNMRTNARITR